MSLQAKLDAFKADFEANKAPREVVEAFHRSTRELIASGQAERALKTGDHAPEFVLTNADGKPVSSKDILAKGPLVLTFYRGAWCPYCNMELQALEEVVEGIRSRGATLVAISQQTAPNSRRSQLDNNLSFQILTDQGGEVADKFGLRWKLEPYLIDVFKMFKVDLPAIHNEKDWTLPMPARYVIGTDGVIAYAEVNPDYTRRPEPSELFPVLDQLVRQAAE